MSTMSAALAAALDRSTPSRSTKSPASLTPAVSSRDTGTPSMTAPAAPQQMHDQHQLHLGNTKQQNSGILKLCSRSETCTLLKLMQKKTFHTCFNNIPGGSWNVCHNGSLAPTQGIEQAALANVRPADQGHLSYTHTFLHPHFFPWILPVSYARF